MLVMITLTIMIVITLFSVIAGNSFIGTVVENVVDNDLIINGTSSTLEVDSSTLFNIDPVIGFTLTIIVIVGLASVLGITVLGSGLSPTTVRVMIIGITYAGVWAVFSLLAEPLISSIDTFGSLMYVSLTIFYVIGVVQKISDGGD